MFSRLVRAMIKSGAIRIERHDPKKRHLQLMRLHRKVQRERDVVRSGRERMTT